MNSQQTEQTQNGTATVRSRVDQLIDAEGLPFGVLVQAFQAATISADLEGVGLGHKVAEGQRRAADLALPIVVAQGCDDAEGAAFAERAAGREFRAWLTGVSAMLRNR